MSAITVSDVASVANACEVLDVSRSAYYVWRKRSRRSASAATKNSLLGWRQCFGNIADDTELDESPRNLADLGQRCGPRKVAKLLKSQGLRAIQPKSFVPKTTDSRHRLGYSPNLLLEFPSPTGINQLWVGDITYIPLRGGAFSYLAMLMDRYSRSIVGWRLEENMTEELVLPVLRMAICKRQPPAKLIHHTDRGGQYAGTRYRAMLQRADFRQSMSRPDNCYDNAFIESCFGTIKTELEMTEYENQRSAFREIGQYIDYYQNERKHSALDYLTPRQFERLLNHKT